MKTKFLLFLIIILTSYGLSAQSRSDDSLATIKTALNYIQGYYTNDASRMEQALHPELAKRMIDKNDRGEDQFHQMSALTLINGTKYHPPIPVANQKADVYVTDIFKDAAMVKIITNGWIDFLQLHRWRGNWVIVNVLWEKK